MLGHQQAARHVDVEQALPNGATSSMTGTRSLPIATLALLTTTSTCPNSPHGFARHEHVLFARDVRGGERASASARASSATLSTSATRSLLVVGERRRVTTGPDHRDVAAGLRELDGDRVPDRTHPARTGDDGDLAVEAR